MTSKGGFDEQLANVKQAGQRCPRAAQRLSLSTERLRHLASGQGWQAQGSSTTRSTSGACRSTSPRAWAAPRAWSPARRKTTSRSSARSRSPRAAKCTGSAWTGISPRRRTTPSMPTIRRSSRNRSPACIAKPRRAKRSARSTPRCTPRTASTRWPTTAASAPAIARTTARTRPAASISSITTSATRSSPITSTGVR